MTLGKTSALFGRGGRGRALKVAGVIATVAGLTVIAACSSSSGGSSTTLQGISGAGMYGSLPAASGTPHAGTLKIGLLGGSAPTWIYPQVTSAADSIYDVDDFTQLMYRPLYWTVNGTADELNEALSLADAPAWSNGDKTVSITLKNWKWSNGTAITSQDVEFYYYLMKASLKESAANWADYSPGLSFPDDVASVSTPDSKTIVFNFNRTTNPSWFILDEASAIFAEPSQSWDVDATGGAPVTDWATHPADATKIYNYLSTQAKSLGTYATNPLWQVVSGPYKLTSFNSTTGNFAMTPNTAYSGPHGSVVSPLQTTFYTSDDAEFNAVKAGQIDFGWVAADDIPDAKSVSSSYGLWGYPGFGWQGAIYNYSDKTGDFGNVISQLYIRQALAHLVDQTGLIKADYYNAGAPDYGIVSEYPTSPYIPTNGTSDPYPYSTADATALLKAHGWSIVPDGTDVCQSPGTASDECGAGIPAGTKLAWDFDYSTTPTINGLVATEVSAIAKSIGIELTLRAGSFDTLTANDNDQATPADTNDWAMDLFGGFTDSTYPTTEGLLNTGAGENMGNYSNSELNTLIDASVNSTNPNAVKNELEYVGEQAPFLFFPNPDWQGNGAGLLAISKQISGDPQYFADYTQYFLTPEFWYFKK